jgi:hypothetical protein
MKMNHTVSAYACFHKYKHKYTQTDISASVHDIYIYIYIYIYIQAFMCINTPPKHTCVHVGMYTFMYVCAHILFETVPTAILIIIGGLFQIFQRFSTSKLVLKTVKSRVAALNYYANGSIRRISSNLCVCACMYVCVYVSMYVCVYVCMYRQRRHWKVLQVHACMRTYMHAYARTYIRTNIQHTLHT